MLNCKSYVVCVTEDCTLSTYILVILMPLPRNQYDIALPGI